MDIGYYLLHVIRVNRFMMNFIHGILNITICFILQENEILYYISYHGNFRYVPKDSPREQVFKVTGVQVPFSSLQPILYFIFIYFISTCILLLYKVFYKSF